VRGYSATQVFSYVEQAILRRVTHMVEEIDPTKLPRSTLVEERGGAALIPPLRCHELACAVAHYVGDGARKHFDSFLLVDGKYGHVDHSWIEWTYNRRVIFDVYCVRRLPMVQLVSAEGLLPEHRDLYRGDPGLRSDARVDVVEYLLKFWKERQL
jgi:hypothetical protein